MMRQNGELHSLLRLHGWERADTLTPPDRAAYIRLGKALSLTVWVEKDDFNSGILQIPQGRLLYRFHPQVALSPPQLSELSAWLNEYLSGLPYALIYSKVVGNSVQEFHWLEQAGFQLILGNTLYHLPKARAINPVVFNLKRYSIEIIDLKTRKLSQNDLRPLLEMAERSFFDDRFFMDYRIPKSKVGQRFLKIVENALAGEIADMAAISRNSDGIMGLIFFGIKDGYAGRWFTALSYPGFVARGFNNVSFTYLLDTLKERNLSWSYTCAQTNFLSASIAQQFRFIPKAISFDFHFWNKKYGGIEL